MAGYHFSQNVPMTYWSYTSYLRPPTDPPPDSRLWGPGVGRVDCRRPRNDFKFFVLVWLGTLVDRASRILRTGQSLRRVANSSAYQWRSRAEATVIRPWLCC
jgi:hypothetical protein